MGLTIWIMAAMEVKASAKLVKLKLNPKLSFVF